MLINLTPEIELKLQKISQMRGIPVDQIIQEAIIHYVYTVADTFLTSQFSALTDDEKYEALNYIKQKKEGKIK